MVGVVQNNKIQGQVYGTRNLLTLVFRVLRDKEILHYSIIWIHSKACLLCVNKIRRLGTIVRMGFIQWNLDTIWQPNCGNRSTDNPGTSFQPSAKLWKAIWSLNVPKKIRIFWWRVCKNGLATKENLFRRRCAPSDICPICNSEVESIEHLLFFCSWAHTVWFGCKIMFNGPCGSPNSAIQWTAKIYQALHKKEATAMVSKVAFIAWNVWKSRNNFVFRNYD